MVNFGTLSDGSAVDIIAISDGRVTAEILTYGATIRSLTVPDRDGNPVDVVLGYDDPKEYETRSGRLGAVIGRFANRIGDARFTLNGREHMLTANRGQDHIHGGNRGFDKKIWHIVRESGDSVTLGLHSGDGEEGYPGNLETEVTYSVGNGSLMIGYSAVSDADTVVNLTNHSYFNLGGSGIIEDHEVTLLSDRYTDCNGRGIPTGQIIPVGGGRLDLRNPCIMGNMLFYGGYDHNYLLDNDGCMMRFSEVYCGRTGIRMTASTDMPAVQFYTAEGLKETPGKNGQVYGKRSGLCLETQFCPDSPNHDNFPSCVLRKGERYSHCTVYSFSAE